MKIRRETFIFQKFESLVALTFYRSLSVLYHDFNFNELLVPKDLRK